MESNIELAVAARKRSDPLPLSHRQQNLPSYLRSEVPVTPRHLLPKGRGLDAELSPHTPHMHAYGFGSADCRINKKPGLGHGHAGMKTVFTFEKGLLATAT